ncbi:MAG: glycosyltransferase family 4 protein [Ignavibacteriales bacterium]|nr:glycosyltransferase family 4 protein [Ignavibacteriales bacterium]
MKILFTFGGLPHYYNSVLNRLNRIEGLEIVVVAPGNRGETLGEGVHQKNEGLEFRLIRLEEYKTFYGKPFFKGFTKVLKQEKPDAVVTIWPYVLAFVFNPYLHLLAALGKIKLIEKEIPFGVPKFKETFSFYSKRNSVTENLEVQASSNKFINFIRLSSLALIRVLYYNFCHAHVNYIDDAYDILGSYGVKKEKIFITYNSPDTDVLLEAKKEVDKLPPVIPENKFRLIHVGRLVPWKRVELLIKATALLKNKFPEIELLVIGDGPQKDGLEKLALSLPIESNVKFIGGVYEPVLLGRYLKASTIYALAGMGGLSINEAMCFNKPIVCSVCDGTEKKLVRDGINGNFFEEGNEDDLVIKLDYLFSNPELIEKMGKSSGEIIRNDVNIHTVIDGYVRAFNYVSKNKFGLKYNRT